MIHQLSTKNNNFKSKSKRLKIQELSKDKYVYERIEKIPQPSNDPINRISEHANNFNGMNGKMNYFNILPDEIILRIFSNLPHFMLKTCCAVVCKHWNELSDDFSLWKKIDYGKKNIRAIYIRKLIALGVEQLEFSKAMLQKYVPLFPVPFKRTYTVKRFSRLQYLYLNRFTLPYHDNKVEVSKFTADILSVCACLKILKLRSIYLNCTICHHISMNKDIKELYWILCTKKRSLKNNILKIFQQCKKLQIVDFSRTHLLDEEMWSITNNLPSCLSSLTLFLWPLTKNSTFETELEKHIKQIIHRCPNITYLKIAYRGPPYYSILKFIVNNLPMLKTFDISRFGNQSLSIKDLFLLKEARKLTELIIPWTYSTSDISLLKNTLKGVEIYFINISARRYY